MTAEQLAFLLDIAKKNHLCNTLVETGNDSRDFPTVAVWNIREALQQAFAAGLEAGKKNGAP